MKYFSTKNFKHHKDRRISLIAGFTLIEMITVIAIFVVVTGIILANLPGFRSKNSLELVTQEVAIQVRGAQMYAMNTLVGGLTDTTIFGYGIYVPSTGRDFKLYYYTNSSLSAQAPTAKESYQLPKGYSFANDGSSVIIKFKRLSGGGAVMMPYTNVSCIRVANSDASKKMAVKVTASGQISVVANENCTNS